MKTYLDERNAENLHQTTVLAEDYSLTHKDTFPSGVKDSSAGLKSVHSDGAFSPGCRAAKANMTVTSQ